MNDIIIVLCLAIGIAIRTLVPFLRKYKLGQLQLNEFDLKYVVTAIITAIGGTLFIVWTQFNQYTTVIPDNVALPIYVIAIFFGYGGNDAVNEILKILTAIQVFSKLTS